MIPDYIRTSLAAAGIAPHLRDGLIRYAVGGVRPGGFVRACLAADLAQARSFRGEDLPTDEPERILAWAVANLPRVAWGAYAAVDAWRGLDAERKRGAA